MNRIRITHIIDGLSFGGAERMVYECATRLSRDRYDVDVVSLSRLPESQQPFVGLLRAAGIMVTAIPKRSAVDATLVKRLQKHLEQRQTDIVQTHLFAADIWGTCAAVRGGVQAIVSTEHGLNTDEGTVKRRLKSTARMQQHAIVAISDTVKSYIIEQTPAVSGRVHRIYNGIDVQRFVAADRKPSATPTQIAVVGRIEQVKGQRDLVAALPLVRSPFALRCVGNGKDRAAVERLVKKLRLHDRVTYEDARPDVEQIYRTADIVIVPSRSEGLGIVVLEALASGCAVIANRIPGIAEIITDKLHGMLVDMQDTHAVAEAIDSLIAHPDIRMQLAHAGAEMVRARFSIDTTVLEYEQLYHSLLSRP